MPPSLDLKLEVASSHKTVTAASILVSTLDKLGVTKAFGVSGGAIAAIWHSFSTSPIDVVHCRHETGAVFAATEYHFSSHEPVAVFTTSGPGLTNALTGLLSARDEGAKVILISPISPAANRTRWLIQETTFSTMPADLYRSGPLFHFASIIEDPAQLSQTMVQLAAGLRQPGGFMAHLAVPPSVQSASIECAYTGNVIGLAPNTSHMSLSPDSVKRYADLLLDGPTAIWVGFGARHAAEQVRELAIRLQARVICSPRGKGVFPENHPLFIGVTGMGGHDLVTTELAEIAPQHILVLGSRLGEPSSFYDARLTPGVSFIHVDIDPAVPGVSYPTVPTEAVCTEIGSFLTALLTHIPERSPYSLAQPTADQPTGSSLISTQLSLPLAANNHDRVRPQYLMKLIQARLIDPDVATLLADSGNSFVWTTHYLQFHRPNQYRVSTGVGSMGHAAAGVLGSAIALKNTSNAGSTPSSYKKAVAIVGDGAMLMNNEINTAVHHSAPALWIVLNDGRYNMCAQGMETLGLTGDATLPTVDFARFAIAQGATGLQAKNERQLEIALEAAIASTGPCVLDVWIDPTLRPPSDNRNSGLKRQMVFPQTPS